MKPRLGPVPIRQLLGDAVPPLTGKEAWDALHAHYGGKGVPGRDERVRAIIRKPEFQELTVKALRAFLCVVAHADGKTAVAWPGSKTLQRVIAPNRYSSDRSRAMKSLIDAGFLEILVPGGGRGRATVYRIGDLTAKPPEAAAPVSNPRQRVQGVTAKPPAAAALNPRQPLPNPTTETTIQSGREQNPEAVTGVGGNGTPREQRRAPTPMELLAKAARDTDPENARLLALQAEHQARMQ